MNSWILIHVLNEIKFNPRLMCNSTSVNKILLNSDTRYLNHELLILGCHGFVRSYQMQLAKYLDVHSLNITV